MRHDWNCFFGGVVRAVGWSFVLDAMETGMKYEVEVAANGGVVVHDDAALVAAFTNINIFAAWLKAQVPSANAHETAAVDAGWIPWSGGEMPVDRDVMVDVKFRLCRLERTGLGRRLDWHHKDSPDDIIAYRISKDQNIEA